MEMQNVGVMNQKQINSLVKQFKSLKGSRVQEGTIFISVKTPANKEVFSAARLNETTWHVRAIRGLVTPAA